MKEKKTALKWFFDNLKNHEIQAQHFELYRQALQIEKEQHGQTWDAALDKYEARAGNYMRAYEDFDDYYEQFKNK
jgi:predicted LPLAT superfamily acyltransferase